LRRPPKSLIVSDNRRAAPAPGEWSIRGADGTGGHPMAMELETLNSGFGLLEGPRCDEQGRLYFSDVPNGGVYRRSTKGEIETLIPKRRGVGGIALNQGGGIVCSGRGLIYWNEATRTSRDLFVEWEGRKLNGLNDLQPDDQGSIYVGSL